MKTGIKTYFLPRELRPELRKIWGIPFFNGQKEILKKFQQFIKKKRFKKIITVGDYCSLTLPSDIKIFDGKIKRSNKTAVVYGFPAIDKKLNLFLQIQSRACPDEP